MLPENKNKKSLQTYIERLDVLCEVIRGALEPGGRATKHDLRLIYNAAQKVVDTYQQEQKEKKKDNEQCGYSSYSIFEPEIENV